jgi:hypothetical protein
METAIVFILSFISYGTWAFQRPWCHLVAARVLGEVTVLEP